MWGCDRTRIYFSSARDDTGFMEIYSMDASDGGNVTREIRERSSVGWQPSIRR